MIYRNFFCIFLKYIQDKQNKTNIIKLMKKMKVREMTNKVVPKRADRPLNF